VFLRCAALLQTQHGLVTRRQLLDAGLDERALRRLTKQGSLLTLRRGVYVERELWEALDPYRGRPLLRVRAARMTLGGDYVLSHDSAALVHGLGVPDAARALVHVTRKKVHGDAVRAGVKHHLAPYSPDQVVVIDGLPVLDLARTALDMAREHGLVAGVACCDRALRLGVSRAALEEERRRMWCWPFSTVMADAVHLADAGAESWLESEARLVVIGLGLGRPETQFGLSDGHRTAYCDLRIRRHLFEVDGTLKYDEDNIRGLTPREVLREEKKRQDFLTGFKLGVSRITAHDCRAGRRAAEARLLREYADTCARFGTDVGDLAPYVVRRPRPPGQL
jgi:predicted transcriptional regulator of viral defense system